MRFIFSLALMAVALAACGPTPPIPAATVAEIKTIGVIVSPWDQVPAVHRGFTVFTNESQTYSAKDWHVPEAFLAGIRDALEPRFKVIAIPTVPVPDPEDAVTSSFRWDLDNIVGPSARASAAKADAYIYVDFRGRTDPVYFTSRELRGCGLIDMSRLVNDEHVTKLYCIASLYVVDATSTQAIGSGTLMSPDYDDVAVADLPDFGWQSARLSPAQIEAASKAMAATIRANIPAALTATGLR
jgi:hypothetical protein